MSLPAIAVDAAFLDIDRLDVYRVAVGGGDILMMIIIIVTGCQKLQRADAIAADGGEEAVGIGPFGANLLGNPLAQGIRVRQQVVEHGSDFRSTIGILAKGK